MFLHVRLYRNVPDFVTYVVYDLHSFALRFVSHLTTSYKRGTNTEWFFVSLVNNDNEISWYYTFIGIDDAGTHHIRSVTYEPHRAHINGYKVSLRAEFYRASYGEKGRFVDTYGHWHSV